ncbi:hypothetical protein BDW02DRAFT_559738 [Decorospora gaudefroyi]|uniref:Uncharacterized protein n=1 Tax=Decorospora gaudefroyi TaxID=184978 RepID=A0A6A5K1H3_9PLEO|nr:hypothetical protein BDW02DRAFT_559738 [Decorospora gaudefroyi]
MFGPLSTAYSTELSNYLHRSHGILPVQKGDFFELFWRAWGATFKKETIRKSFEATGIHPANPEVILKRFGKEASSLDESSASCLSGEDWLKLESIVRRTVKDQSDKDVKKLRRSLHYISAQNSILRGEIRGLRDALLKAERSHLKEQARLYKLQQAQEKRVERERLKEVREKERAAKESRMLKRSARKQLATLDPCRHISLS